MQYSKYIKNIYALLSKTLINRYVSLTISSTHFAIWSTHCCITSHDSFRRLHNTFETYNFVAPNQTNKQMKATLFISAVQSCLAFILACFYIFAGTLIANVLTFGYISNRGYHLSAVISSLLGVFLMLILCGFTINIYKQFED